MARDNLIAPFNARNLDMGAMEIRITPLSVRDRAVDLSLVGIAVERDLHAVDTRGGEDVEQRGLVFCKYRFAEFDELLVAHEPAGRIETRTGCRGIIGHERTPKTRKPGARPG